MTTHSERLEHEAEHVRWQVSQTLDELRSRITPGQVIDQVVDYAKEGNAREFVNNFGRQVKENPLSLTLIGAGLAWLMLGDRRLARARTSDSERSAGEHEAQLADRINEAGHNLGDRADESLAVLGTAARDTKARADAALDRAGDAMEHATESAKEAAESSYHRAAKSVEEAAGSAQDTATSTYHAVARKTGDLAGKVGSTATAAVRRTKSVGRSALDLCREQPLVLAGLGLAVGAAIGTLLPRTPADEDVLGTTGGSKDDYGAKEEDQVRRAASAKSETFDNAAAMPDALPKSDRHEDDASHGGSMITDGQSD
jgi:ElaB/YqjD/DUF883 family membrane-anchored ribosome-binding protein